MVSTPNLLLWNTNHTALRKVKLFYCFKRADWAVGIQRLNTFCFAPLVAVTGHPKCNCNPGQTLTWDWSFLQGIERARPAYHLAVSRTWTDMDLSVTFWKSCVYLFTITARLHYQTLAVMQEQETHEPCPIPEPPHLGKNPVPPLSA